MKEIVIVEVPVRKVTRDNIFIYEPDLDTQGKYVTIKYSKDMTTCWVSFPPKLIGRSKISFKRNRMVN